MLAYLRSPAVNVCTVLTLALLLTACVETLPKVNFQDGLPNAPTLKDKNASIALAWDRASLDCRTQHKPKGAFCEQLKIEGEFLSCSADRFANSAVSLRYPAPDSLWVWHNCVKTTANLLLDGYYLSKQEIERRLNSCQARFDPEPEFPTRQSGWLAPLVALFVTNDKEALRAVLPGDFGINQPQVALSTCAARFAPQVQGPAADARPTPVVDARPPSSDAVPQNSNAASQAVLPAVLSTPPEAETSSRQKAKPRTASLSSSKESTSSRAASASNRAGSTGSGVASSSIEMKGACPIPGACGPSVPADAVKRP